MDKPNVRSLSGSASSRTTCEICGVETVRDGRGRHRRACGPICYRELKRRIAEDRANRGSFVGQGAYFSNDGPQVEIPNPAELEATTPDEVFQLGLRSLTWFLTEPSLPVPLRYSAAVAALRVPGVRHVAEVDETRALVRQLFAEDDDPQDGSSTARA